jgi:hypothetical protein
VRGRRSDGPVPDAAGHHEEIFGAEPVAPPRRWRTLIDGLTPKQLQEAKTLA